jgi:hypothetical protein
MGILADQRLAEHFIGVADCLLLTARTAEKHAGPL